VSRPVPIQMNNEASKSDGNDVVYGALASGVVVGKRYRIASVLGRGGFGITYSATYGELDARAAIKELFLPGSVRYGSTVQPPEPERARFAMIRDRFVEEGRMLARFDHPGIVKVFDVVRDYNTTYLVMELLEGITLETKVRQGLLTEDQVRLLLLKVCESLATLHADDTLHRDIKPSNVLCHATRGPVLIDFGSSRQLISGDSQVATAMVTAGFAPVEQYQTRGVFGPATDLYSLAATALFALTGVTPVSSLDRLEDDDSLVVPDTDDPRIAEALRQCLQVRFGDRPQHVGELVTLLTSGDRRQGPRPATDGSAEESADVSAEESADLSAEVPVPFAIIPPRRSNAATLRESRPSPPADAARSASLVEPRVRRPTKGRTFMVTLVAIAAVVGITFGAVNVMHHNDDGIRRLSSPGSVLKFAWSPDGERFATAGQDGTVKLWTARGKILRTLTAHTDGVSSVAWSPDGRSVATGSWDSTVRLWDAESGAATQTINAQAGSVSAVAYSPDGKTLASGDADGSVKLWDAATGDAIRNLPGHTDRVLTISWSPDSSSIVAGGADDTITTWLANDPNSLTVLKGHSADVVSVAWSPDGKTIASAGDDKRVRLWDSTSHRLRRTIGGFPQFVVAVGWSPQSSELAVGGWDGAVTLMNREGKNRKILRGHTDHVLSVAFSPIAPLVASSSADGTVRLWDTTSGVARQVVISGHTNYVLALAWSPDSRSVASGSWDSKVRVWDINNVLNPVSSFDQGVGFVAAVAWSPDGEFVAAGGADGTVKVWRTSSDADPRVLVGHTGRVAAVAWAADGTRFASASWDGTVKLWDPTSDRVTKTLSTFSGAATSVSWSPDGKQVAVGSADGTIRIFDAATGESEHILKNPNGGLLVSAVAWSPTGTTMASSGADSAVQLWDTSTWSISKTLGGHTNSVLSLAWSPDGSRLATGSLDNTVRVWDAATGETTEKFTDHRSGIRAVAWSPDGKRLASADNVIVVRRVS
jgi:WD40 repeat protein/serine/threonine protein kinase